ncbi:carbonic anhydrase 2-like [Saccostrea echinata]|uniref:carbonic anhydrase 2-like n=1 Tax=Saccostrea echinata TaxID=191078 RepID=UPI002A801747|nr:carbonic anhydrase 2-like [Saccostrea echinata]
MTSLKILLILCFGFLNLNTIRGTSLYSNDRVPLNDCCTGCNSSEAHFGYTEATCHGPTHWFEITTGWSFCGGSIQSPVNLRTSDSVYQQVLRTYPLRFQNLCLRIPARIRNNGHSPHFDTESDAVGLYNIPGLPGQRFTFNEFHIHLGRTFAEGSEHLMDGNKFNMEAHLVFYNSRYGDAITAKRSPRGLAVMGVMIQVAENGEESDGVFIEKKDKDCGVVRHRPYSKCVCDDTNPYSAYICKVSGRCQCEDDNDCPGLSKCRLNDVIPGRYCGKPKACRVRYARNLSYIMENYYRSIRFYTNVAPRLEDRQWVEIPEGITPSDVLPYDWSYYTYQGSLTTPPCFETVTWINMRCPIKVSRRAYNNLALVRDVNGPPLVTFGLDRPAQRGMYNGPSVSVSRSFQWDTVGTETSFCNVN